MKKAISLIFVFMFVLALGSCTKDVDTNSVQSEEAPVNREIQTITAASSRSAHFRELL